MREIIFEGDHAEPGVAEIPAGIDTRGIGVVPNVRVSEHGRIQRLHRDIARSAFPHIGHRLRIGIGHGRARLSRLGLRQIAQRRRCREIGVAEIEDLAVFVLAVSVRVGRRRGVEQLQGIVQIGAASAQDRRRNQEMQIVRIVPVAIAVAVGMIKVLGREIRLVGSDRGDVGVDRLVSLPIR